VKFLERECGSGPAARCVVPETLRALGSPGGNSGAGYEFRKGGEIRASPRIAGAASEQDGEVSGEASRGCYPLCALALALAAWARTGFLGVARLRSRFTARTRCATSPALLAMTASAPVLVSVSPRASA